MRYLVKKTNLPRVYHDVAEYNLSDEEVAGKNDYYRDRSMEIYSGKSNFEVLCIGDSFTNGGNTFWDNSYPYKLFLKFNEKITVRNLGVCASTTEQIANRLEDFYSSDQYKHGKRYVVAVMAGSADVFAGKNLVQSISALNISKEQKWVEMSKKIQELKAPAFFSQFYFYKVSTLLAQEIKKRISTSSVHFADQVDFSSHGLESCRGVSLSDQRVTCLNKALKGDSYKDVSQSVKEYLIIRFLLEKKVFKSSEVTTTLRDFMTLAKLEPQILERDYLVMNLLGLVKLQDIISFKELSELIQNESQGLSSTAKEVNNVLIQNSAYWYENLHQLNKERDLYWEKILNLAKTHNSEIVVMSYPLPYQSTNNYLASLSTEKNLEHIDLEKIFSSASVGHTELLDDWEHCSPEGYDLIAQTLYEKIEKMDVKNSNKSRN